ncbi:phage portal protein [Sunxiuqinia indica]|uniref:phage portal protein n=1 Tax=Sunxiuqinia indica TaxID=2692584 RepID=UPI00135B5C84|nr:phage portal protein [Sunxiuqinia indica]
MASKLRHKLAEKILGGAIVAKSDPLSPLNISSAREVLLGAGTPMFTRLGTMTQLEKEYCENPVLASVINLKADYASNARIYVRDIRNGEIFTDKIYRESKGVDKIVQKMFRLKNNPNPVQSTKEFLALASIFKDVFGNGYTYANSGTDDINIKDVEYLWHVWSQFMIPDITGKYFDRTSKEGIIRKWEFVRGVYTKEFHPDEILHRKEPNVRFTRSTDMVLGQSRQESLSWALSNIKIAYESRNVIARERGMRAIISSAQADGVAGTMPMDDTEKEEVQESLKTEYGFMEGQSQFMVTKNNINVHHIDQDVRKLGLLNEIASDAMIVCSRYNVPETLVKLYMKGATFENQDTAERRMYQNTTIPEEEDRWEDINNWLKCRDFNYEYIVSFDHIPVLQKNEKDKAETNKFVSAQYKEMFFAGACTYNDWIQAVGLPATSWGNKRITEMSMDEIQKIKGNYTINDSLENPNA